MKRDRERDVIDVNIEWTIYMGSKMTGAYSIGIVKAATAYLARKAARQIWPDRPRLFAERAWS